MDCKRVGRYEATVVDGDDLSFTIIFIGDDKKYQELLGEGPQQLA